MMQKLFSKISPHVRKIEIIAALLFSLGIVFRWFFYVHIGSVNVLFWDQWDFYRAFFENFNGWQIFTLLHGPHRQGLGMIITKCLADLTGWNSRIESIAIGCIIFLAMVFAFFLKRRLTRQFSFVDVAIPLIFLVPAQIAAVTIAPNLSHGSVPLLLLILLVWIWTFPLTVGRNVILLILNFLLIYTGFGLLAGIITPVIFGIDCCYAAQRKERKQFVVSLVSVLVSLFSFGIFFWGYQFDPAITNFQFPVEQFWKAYPLYIAVTLAHFFGIGNVDTFSVLFGSVILLSLVWIFTIHALRFLKPLSSEVEQSTLRLSRSIVILIGFSLIFSLGAAIGRVSLGLHSATTPRYVTYLIPGFFGLYLHLRSLSKEQMKEFFLVVMVIGLAVGTSRMSAFDSTVFEYFVQGKERWKQAYLLTEDIQKTNELANFQIYPAGREEETRLKEKLEYLKKNKLNLYLDSKS